MLWCSRRFDIFVLRVRKSFVHVSLQLQKLQKSQKSQRSQKCQNSKRRHKSHQGWRVTIVRLFNVVAAILIGHDHSRYDQITPTPRLAFSLVFHCVRTLTRPITHLKLFDYSPLLNAKRHVMAPVMTNSTISTPFIIL